MGFTVVVVVNSERPDVVTTRRDRDVVAILLARGKREVTESLLLREMEVEWLGDHGGGTAREELVGQPGGVVGVGGRSEAPAVNVVAGICKSESNAVSVRIENVSPNLKAS